MKTKLLGILMVLTVAVTSLPAGTTANAAETNIVQVQEEESVEALGATEAEIKAGAVQLTSGVAKIDHLDGAPDYRWYKFIVPKVAGYVTVNFAKQDLDAGGAWHVQIYSESNLSDNLYDWHTYSKLTSEKLTLPAGTCYIKVLDGAYNPAGIDYSLTITFTADSAYESESNNTKETANVITSGKNYYGKVNSNDLYDWYKFSTTDSGYFTVDLGPLGVGQPSGGWTMFVYDANSNKLYDKDGIKESTKTYKIPCKPGNYYVKIATQEFFSPSDSYSLKLTFSKTSTMESEYNNTYKTANTIKTGVAYTGAFQGAEDAEDWYKFKLTSSGAVYLKFNRSNNTSPEKIKQGWKIELYKGVSATPLQTLTTKDVATLKLNLSKGMYYVRVSFGGRYGDWDSPLEQDYSLKVNYLKAPKAVKITSTAGGKKKAIIKWTKSTDASGYYIYRATSKRGTYKKIATITKKTTVKYTDKKALKSKKTYYYKVVAYKKTNGLTATSSASGIKGVKIK